MNMLHRIGTANNIKKLIGAALMLSLTFGVTVGASGTTIDNIKSKGNIEYDGNKDGNAEVLFYSEDLTTLSSGIDSLNKQISVLSSSFDTLSDTTSQYKSAIISGLNGNVYSKANIPADTSFAELVGYINNIPAPTTVVGNYYDGGDNSGLGVGISSSNTTVGIDVDGVSTINIGVNESITLPSGYYPNDITIQNSVANRGALSKESNEDGYYTDIANFLGSNKGKISVSIGGYVDSDGGGGNSGAVVVYITCNGKTYTVRSGVGSGGRNYVNSGQYLRYSFAGGTSFDLE